MPVPATRANGWSGWLRSSSTRTTRPPGTSTRASSATNRSRSAKWWVALTAHSAFTERIATGSDSAVPARTSIALEIAVCTRAQPEHSSHGPGRIHGDDAAPRSDQACRLDARGPQAGAEIEDDLAGLGVDQLDSGAVELGGPEVLQRADDVPREPGPIGEAGG